MIPIRVRFLTLPLTFDVKTCYHWPVVSGCPFKDPNDPGNLQFDWLEVQLKEYRNRGMQV
jgi:hypothetical protein